jgi:hypothetical protein
VGGSMRDWNRNRGDLKVGLISKGLQEAATGTWTEGQKQPRIKFNHRFRLNGICGAPSEMRLAKSM